MKNIFTTLIFSTLLTLNFSLAQNSQGKSDDAGRIAIKSYVPKDLGDLTPKAQKALKGRLERIITKNGIGGSSYDNRFVLTAKVVELSKDKVPTTPPVYNYQLEVTLLVGDAVEGTLFASHVIEVKGAGNTYNSAYMKAVKRIKDRNPEYQEFLDEAKNKIIEYYNSKCDFYLKEAESLTSQDQFEAAIATLTSIPEVCKECYDKAMDAVGPVYKKQIDKACKGLMLEANNAWSAGQDVSAAENASVSLGKIDPNSACYNDAQNLAGTIAKRIKELDQREWDFKLKEQQDEVDIRKADIKAARDIGVAYGENQPQSIEYNVVGWYGY
ncbi:hypothetical protein OAA13_00785 [Crocinitomicaceae bacterium]|jgi:hypothetical protein|nr:hypothetical protein [Crocinitomicaceae bacterium]